MSLEASVKAVSPSTSAVAKISEKALKRGLLDSGFKRLGRHLLRQANSIIHGIHFRAGTGIATPVGTFTFSIVITSEMLYQAWAGRPLPRNPTTVLFPLCQGIVQLAPGTSIMWDARSSGEIEALTDQIVELIHARVLPFFDKYPSPEVLLERVRASDVPHSYPLSHWNVVRSILAKNAGFDEEAHEALNQAYRQATPIGSRHYILAIAKRLGIDITGSLTDPAPIS